MTLVDKMATAIQEESWTDSYSSPELCMGAARAALAVVLEALREPSDGMLDAYWDAPGDGVNDWKAMLAQFEKENLPSAPTTATEAK